jgi:peptide/nickel transport system substrate-binding protein
LKSKIAIISLVTGLLVLAACSGCGPGNANGPTGKPNPPFQGDVSPDALVDTVTGNYGGTLVLATPGNPKTFNAVTAIGTSSLWVIGNTIYKSLTAYNNADQQDSPAVASSWDTSPDGLTWTFHLRRGVTWSDGEPFNADDVVFTMELNFDPNIPSANRDLLKQSDGSYPSVEKVDDYTVRLHLKEVNAIVVAALNEVYLIPKHKWEAVYRAGNFAQALSVATDPKDVVGLGPYRLVSYTPDQVIVLERNPYYWKVDKENRRLPYLDRVIFLIVQNNNTWALKMVSGEIDMHQQIYPDTLGSIKQGEKKGDYEVIPLGPSFNISYMAFNQDTRKDATGKPHVDPVKLNWFRNVKFRQAISYGIDREAIVRTALNGFGTPVYGFDTSANKLWYTDNIPKYPYDPVKAADLLKEIGIWDRDGDGLAEDSQGHPIRFTVITNSNNDVRVNTATKIKENLRKLGIDVTLQPIDLNQVQVKIQDTRDFEAVVGTWQSAVPPDPVESKDILMPSGIFYAAFPEQKEPSTDWEKRLAEDMNKCSKTMDLASRQKYYWDAMNIWSEYLPEIDLITGTYFVAAKNKIGNLKASSLANFTYWNIDELYFKY